MTAQTVSSKFFTMGSQVVLAWLLNRGDFGLISKAFTATAFPAVVYQVGVREVLVRRHASLARWSGTAYWVSAVFGLVSALLMLAIAPVAARFSYGPHAFARPETAGQAWKLVQLIAIIAVSVPFVPLANVATAELQHQLRFRALSVIAFLNTSGLAVLSVLFAWLHCGAYSFVLPWPIVGLARWAALCMLSSSRPQLKPRFRRWKYLVGGGTFVLLARGLGTFVLVGDYLMLGHFHSEQALGIYYFAFNLSMQTMILLAMNMEGVLFPALSKIRQDPGRQREVFLRTVRGLALVGVPACLLQAALASPGIHAVFQPKWYPAIPVLQVLSIGMAFRIVGWPTVSMLLAQGRYKAMVLSAGCSAVSFITLTAIASAFSSEAAAPVVMASVVAAHFAVEAPICLYIALRSSRGSASAICRAFGTPMVLGGVAVTLGSIVSRLFPDFALANCAGMAVMILVTAVAYVAGLRQFAPESFESLAGYFRRRVTINTRTVMTRGIEQAPMGAGRGSTLVRDAA